MRILGYRFNSEAELRRKLQSKKFENETIDSTLDRLRKERWLDDERFAAAFVRTRAQKRIGRLRIKRELSAAGVSDDAAERAVTEHLEPDREDEALLAACQKRMRVLARRHGEDYLATDEGHSKLVSWLVQKGFELDAVLRNVRHAKY
jgi:regulatory protein